MDCPSCKYPDMKVIRSNYDANEFVHRRRECLRCGMRVNTQEQVQERNREKDKHVLIT